jgi:GNAT superfamily N-acetyltransferase
MAAPDVVTPTDPDAIYAVVNDAAEAYRGVIPEAFWHEPYMPLDEVRREIEAGVRFLGIQREDGLLGVMGLQDVRDVSLIRHAYVRRAAQGQGIGSALLEALRPEARGPLLVGTWADASWAVRFYERHGFELMSSGETQKLLHKYWPAVPADQAAVSVVLAAT